MAYVALSRVRSPKGFHLLAFDVDSARCNLRHVVEYNRLRKLYCPNLPPFLVPKCRCRRKKVVLTRPAADDSVDLEEETKPRKSKRASDLTTSEQHVKRNDCEPVVKRRCYRKKGVETSNTDQTESTDNAHQLAPSDFTSRTHDAAAHTTVKQPCCKRGHIVSNDQIRYVFVRLPNLIGVRNVHAQTCYLNAGLQCLAHSQLGQLISDIHINPVVADSFPLVHHLSQTIASLRARTDNNRKEDLWHILCNIEPHLVEILNSDYSIVHNRTSGMLFISSLSRLMSA